MADRGDKNVWEKELAAMLQPEYYEQQKHYNPKIRQYDALAKFNGDTGYLLVWVEFFVGDLRLLVSHFYGGKFLIKPFSFS